MAVGWGQAERVLEEAQLFWLSTVRGDGRPHVTPVLAVWMDGALHFTTGPAEQKARNLAGNEQVVLTTGCNTQEGLDIVIEGRAVRLTDEDRLHGLAEAYVAKYGDVWRFEVRDGAFHREDVDEAWVFAVAPVKAFGFGRGEEYSQTRWRFAGAS
ncbi:MAG TPA: pyridoxamine 5'-phosphate oxidase family protein [Thermomonospora sp.]|nr:pyridoxamine 5'-phosphate oxidase family protein [Thermomonospora sp.]